MIGFNGTPIMSLFICLFCPPKKLWLEVSRSSDKHRHTTMRNGESSGRNDESRVCHWLIESHGQIWQWRVRRDTGHSFESSSLNQTENSIEISKKKKKNEGRARNDGGDWMAFMWSTVHPFIRGGSTHKSVKRRKPTARIRVRPWFSPLYTFSLIDLDSSFVTARKQTK